MKKVLRLLCSFIGVIALMFCCCMDAAGWTIPRCVTSGLDISDAGSSVFTITPDGVQHFLISRAGQSIWHMTIEKDVRTSFIQLGTGVSPSITAAKDGTVHAAYSEGWEIRYRRWSGNTWSAVQTVSPLNGSNLNPSIAAADNGNLHAVWVRQGNIWYNSFVNGSWNTASQITSSGDLQQYFPPRIAVTGNGPVVVYGRTISGAWTGWVASLAGGTWEHTQVTSGPGAANGDIAVGIDGSVTITWDMNYDVFSRTLINGVWGQQLTLQGNSAESTTSRIAVGNGGNAVAVWNEKAGSVTYPSSSQYIGGQWQSPVQIASAGVSPDVEFWNDGFVVEWSNDWNIWTAQSFPDLTAPPSPTMISVEALDQQVNLVWNNPACVDYGTVRIVFRNDRYPVHLSDGQIVLTRHPQFGTDQFTHANLLNGTGYYYSIFLFDSTGNVSLPTSAMAMPAAMSIGKMKTRPDGSAVSLKGKVVSAVFPADGVFYVQETDRSSGVRVSGQTAGLSVGSFVDIEGTLQTRFLNTFVRSERVVQAGSVVVNGTVSPPVALIVNNLTLGGEADAQAAGVIDGVGLTNIGLLMKTYGMILSKTGNSILIDDGSSVSDSSGRTGVFVRCPSTSIPYNVGQHVTVTGVLEGSVPSGWLENRRFIRLRNWDDIVQLN